MKKIFNFIYCLSAAIFIAVFLYGKTTEPAKVYADQHEALINFDVVLIPTIYGEDVTVNENVVNAPFTFTLYPASTSTVSASYTTQDGVGPNPATDSNDYTSVEGTVIFQPGETTQTINIPIIDDSIFEETESFIINFYQNNLERSSFNTITITDNDATPSATPTPSNPGGPGDGKSDGKSSCPECTQPHNPPTTPTPPTPTPPTFSFVPPSILGDSDVITPTPTPKPSLFPTTLPENQNIQTQTENEQAERPMLVKSILSPNELPLDPLTLGLSGAAALFLVLLIVFPAEIFNATVQSNYDEISKWSLVHRTKMYADRLSKLPALFLVTMFAIISSIINSFLSPDIGFNQTTLVMVLGMLLALVVIVSVYDLTRMIYMKRRFGITSKLRAHSIGLFTGTLLVVISRLSNFLPGYCYGLFTGLIYGKRVDARQDGEGLAAASFMLLTVGLLGWFLWIPVKTAAMANNPSFLTLVFDSAFASLWVSTLTATVFGLLPMRFLYGEPVKKWNSKVWALIYFTGVYLFVYTLLNPAVGIYGKTDKVSWIAVLSLFFGFSIFSLSFWGYFRYRANFSWKAKK